MGAGLGLAVTSALTVQSSALALSAAPDDTSAPWVRLAVEDFPIQRQCSIVWRSDSPLATPAQRFASYFRAGTAAQPLT